jgi:hypothetical protein
MNVTVVVAEKVLESNHHMKEVKFYNLTPYQNNFNTEEKLKWLKVNQHLCAKPFHTIQVGISQSGDFFSSPCCNYTGELGSLTKNEKFKDLKIDIKSSKKHPNCIKCWDTEKTNIFSERVKDMLDWNSEMVNNFLLTGKSNNFNLGVKFGNLCNLACRSCDGNQSSLYAQVKQQHIPVSVSTDISEMPEYWNELLEYTKRLSEEHENLCIGLIGGETLIQPGVIRYIDYLINLPTINNISLSLTSNFTIWDDELFNHMSKIPRVDLTASIDSTGENYHYVRWPAQFSKVQNNVDNYIQLKNRLPNFNTLSIASVFSLNNIFYIKEYIDFLQDILYKDPTILINPIHLDYPGYLSIENLPIRYRPSLLQYIQEALTHQLLSNINLTSMRVLLEGFEQFLKTDFIMLDEFDRFLTETAIFDHRTKCYFKDFNPRLYEILNKEDQLTYKNHLEKI